MGKSTITLQKNVNKNVDAVKDGYKFYNDAHNYIYNLLMKDRSNMKKGEENNSKYDKMIKNVKRLVDTREIPHLLMPYLFSCLRYEDNDYVLDRDKFEKYANEFVDKLSYDFSDRENVSVEEKNKYYYNAIKPYYDSYFAFTTELFKIQKDMYEHTKKHDKLVFAKLFYGFKTNQGYDRNITDDLNIKYYDDTYSTEQAARNFSYVRYLNYVASMQFHNAVVKGNTFKEMHKDLSPIEFSIDKDVPDIFLNYLKDLHHVEINFDPSLYDAIHNPSVKESFFLSKLEPKMNMFYTVSKPHFHFYDNFNSLYVDGKKFTELAEENNRQPARYLTELILEGNHSFDMLDLESANNTISARIVPVKFKHDQKAYNKAHFSVFDRFLNFIGVKKNIRQYKKIEDENFKRSITNPNERFKKIYKSALEEVKKHNENLGKFDIKLNFKCPNFNIKLDINERNNIVVPEEKQSDLKTEKDIQINKSKDKTLNK